MRRDLSLTVGVILMVAAAVPLSAGPESAATGQRDSGENALQQKRDGITVKLVGARYHPQRRRLMIRVEYWGDDLNSLNFGSPELMVDGVPKRLSGAG